MKRIIRIKESEFIKILENIINETQMTAMNVSYPLPNEFNDFQYDLEEEKVKGNNTNIDSPNYDLSNDPMAIALINYLNETGDEDVGLIHVKPIQTYNDYTNWYEIDHNWYAVAIKKKDYLRYNLNIWHEYNKYLIMKLK